MKDYSNNFHIFKRYNEDDEIMIVPYTIMFTILGIDLLSIIIYLFLNKKFSKGHLNCIFWSSYFSFNIPFIFFFTVFTGYDGEFRYHLFTVLGGFVFFMIINFIIYKIYNIKSKSKKNDITSNNDNTKVKLDKGKVKESEITLNDDYDIIINRKSTDQSNHEIDIIDIHSNETTENVHNTNSNINNNNTSNPNLQNVTNQNSINNNNSINSVNNNNVNNNNISNDALLQHINYLQNYIVNNMPTNNGIPQPSYLPNYNNGNGAFVGINNINSNNFNVNNNNINNNNSNNNNSGSNTSLHNTKSISKNEKHGELNNVNTNENNNDNILPSYLEFIE